MTRTATKTSKNNIFHKKNNNFARASRFFVHFFARFCTTTTWKCLIWRFMECVNKQRRNFISLSELDMVPWNSTPWGFAYIWQSKWVGIIAAKTERTQIHFLSDVFVAAPSLDLKVPNFCSSLWSMKREPGQSFLEQRLVIEPSALVIISNPNHFNPKLTKIHCIIKSKCLPIAYLDP